MYFLHTDPVEAAGSICDQDMVPHFKEAFLECFTTIHPNPHKKPTPVLEWLLENNANRLWMIRFCECLAKRMPIADVPWNLLHDLRRRLDTEYKAGETITNFAPFQNVSTNNLHIIATYRAAYVRTRWKYAEWKEIGAPGWFARLAYTLLDERERQDFSLRFQSAGPERPVNKGSSQPQRKEFRDGPSCEINGTAHGPLTLW